MINIYHLHQAAVPSMLKLFVQDWHIKLSPHSFYQAPIYALLCCISTKLIKLMLISECIEFKRSHVHHIPRSSLTKDNRQLKPQYSTYRISLSAKAHGIYFINTVSEPQQKLKFNDLSDLMEQGISFCPNHLSWLWGLFPQ